MLQGILHYKLGAVFHDGAFRIEDFLTAIALGACEYVEHRLALIPFLETARSHTGQHLRLTHVDVSSAEMTFWKMREALHEGDQQIANAGEPELVVQLTTASGERRWLLVEAKLHAEKSSIALEGPTVTDQLAKYWLHLRRIVADAGAPEEAALGVVYITKHPVLPTADLEASERELKQKGHLSPRFYWTNWRELSRIAKANAGESRLLRDLARVLEEHFEMPEIAMAWSWPEPRALNATWTFAWEWPAVPAAPPAWVFSWAWPVAPVEHYEAWRIT